MQSAIEKRKGWKTFYEFFIEKLRGRRKMKEEKFFIKLSRSEEKIWKLSSNFKVKQPNISTTAQRFKKAEISCSWGESFDEISRNRIASPLNIFNETVMISYDEIRFWIAPDLILFNGLISWVNK